MPSSAAGTNESWLYTDPQSVRAADGLANVTVVRLRSGTLYEARVVTASAVLASGAFTSASTGVAEFDDGPVCNVTGQTPRFGVLYFDVQMGDFQVLRRLLLPLLRLLLL